MKANSKLREGRGEAEDDDERKDTESPTFHTLEKIVPTKLGICFPYNTFANNRVILDWKLILNCKRIITKVEKQYG